MRKSLKALLVGGPMYELLYTSISEFGRRNYGGQSR